MIAYNQFGEQTMNNPPLAADGGPTEKNRSMGGLYIFLGVTFAFTWLILALPVLSAIGLIDVALPASLFITIATFGPAVGAITAVIYESGRSGIRPLLAQVVRWRVSWRWYLVVLTIPALVMLAAFFLWQAMGGPALTTPLPAGAWFTIPILIVALLIPSLFEEVGWRGLALPRLQTRFGWLASSLVVGVIWAIWHSPIWFIPDAGFGNLPFPIFMLFTMALSVLFAWLYNGTGGSVLLPALAHAAINAYPSPWNTAVYLLPEAARGIHIQIPVTIVMVVLTVVLVALKGKTPRLGSQVA